MLKRPRTPTTNPAMDYHTADSEHALKRARPFGLMDEVLFHTPTCSQLVLCVIIFSLCARSFEFLWAFLGKVKLFS